MCVHNLDILSGILPKLLSVIFFILVSMHQTRNTCVVSLLHSVDDENRGKMS